MTGVQTCALPIFSVVEANATPAPPKGIGEGKRVKHIMAMNKSENAIEAERDQRLTFMLFGSHHSYISC